jgi:hypothetical protein
MPCSCFDWVDSQSKYLAKVTPRIASAAKKINKSFFTAISFAVQLIKYWKMAFG